MTDWIDLCREIKPRGQKNFTRSLLRLPTERPVHKSLSSKSVKQPVTKLWFFLIIIMIIFFNLNTEATRIHLQVWNQYEQMWN